jgi:hypothetical protein
MAAPMRRPYTAGCRPLRAVPTPPFSLLTSSLHLRTEAVLYRVLREAKDLFTFEMRGLVFKGARLSFYIRPEDGGSCCLRLYSGSNRRLRRGSTGGIAGRGISRGTDTSRGCWKGSRPEGRRDWRRRLKRSRDRPRQAGKEAETGFLPKIPLRAASPPAQGAAKRLRNGKSALTTSIDRHGRKRPQAGSA